MYATEIMLKPFHLEWYAITIANALHEGTLKVCMKRFGDWTEEHFNIANLELFYRGKVYVELKVCAPFGATAQVAGTYHRLVIASGGIDATPLVAVCKERMHN